MIKLIDNHKAISYFVVAFLLSGILVLPQAFVPVAGDYSLLFPQLSPAIAVLLIAIITKNKSIIADIKDKVFFSVGLIKWICAIVLTIFVPVIATSSYLSQQGSLYKPWQGTPVFYVINILFLLMGTVFEEIGWRGFWLPELCKKYSLFSSSIIVGVFWGIWHMNFGLGIAGYIAYILFTTFNSILMAIIFKLSKNSLILMIIWHFLINLSFKIFLNERVSAECLFVIDALFGIICIITVLCKKRLILNKRNQGIYT